MIEGEKRGKADMKYFEKYVSDTVASTGNQNWFDLEGKEKRSRIFYKLNGGETREYSLLYSSVIDSTFSDGEHSKADTVVLGWTLKRVAVAVVKDCSLSIPDDKFITLTFDGKRQKHVDVYGFLCTDRVTLDVGKGDYLCVDTIFCGEKIPYHEECYLVPVYSRDENGEWKEDRKTPVPCMIGCNKKDKMRVTFWGDSITQGIGTPCNSYTHYASVVSNFLGDSYAVYDAGLGFGRANDAGLLASWFDRVKQTDIAVVCFGVNDILRITDASITKNDLKNIVTALKEKGVKVILQTVPPFNYDEIKRGVWADINDYIKTDLKKIVDEVFDCVPVLCDENELHMAKYGGHPNEEGCRAWGEKLYPVIEKVAKSLNR
jgi:lysophospholipase L1-like esterase